LFFRGKEHLVYWRAPAYITMHIKTMAAKMECVRFGAKPQIWDPAAPMSL